MKGTVSCRFLAPDESIDIPIATFQLTIHPLFYSRHVLCTACIVVQWPKIEESHVRCVQITCLPSNDLNPMLWELRSVWSCDIIGQRKGFLILRPGITNVWAQSISFSTSVVLFTLSFSFESFFPCISRYVNHVICIVYKILGAVLLFYGIYLSPVLIQPFSTAVCLTRFSSYITLVGYFVPIPFLGENTMGLNVQSLALFLDEPLSMLTTLFGW